MIENVLVQKGFNLKIRVSIKAAISAFIIALAVALPQLVHLIAGAEGGVKWLPMYLPVLVGGCLLGWAWGLGIGVLSPIVSFAITALAGNPMPVAARLPFMVAELAVFAAVSGLFANKIAQNKWIAFPAVLLAQVAGRLVFLTLVAIFQSVSPLSVAIIWAQIQTGAIALIAQAIIVPVMVMLLARLIEKDSKSE